MRFRFQGFISIAIRELRTIFWGENPTKLATYLHCFDTPNKGVPFNIPSCGVPEIHPAFRGNPQLGEEVDCMTR